MNYQNEVESLRAENAEKLARQERELAIQIEAFEKTGLKFMVLIHQRKGGAEFVSLTIENTRYGTNFDRARMAEYYEGIQAMFRSIYAPHACPIMVAGGTIYENIAPVYIDFVNNTAEWVFGHEHRAEINFTFRNIEDAKQTIGVTFKMPAAPHHNNFSKHVIRRDLFVGKPHNKRDRMEKPLYRISKFDCIHFYDNTYRTYTKDPAKVDQLMQIALTGDNRKNITLEQFGRLLKNGCKWEDAGYNADADMYAPAFCVTAVLRHPSGVIQEEGGYMTVNTDSGLYRIENVKESDYMRIWHKYGRKADFKDGNFQSMVDMGLSRP